MIQITLTILTAYFNVPIHPHPVTTQIMETGEAVVIRGQMVIMVDSTVKVILLAQIIIILH